MVRIKSSVASKKRRKRVLKKAKGQFGQRSRHFSQAKRSVIKGLVYSYRDRKVKKRAFRRVWIIRIKAACEKYGVTYSRFMKGLSEANVAINRKMLADISVHSPSVFQKLVKVAKESIEKNFSQTKKPATKTKAA